VIIGLFVSTLAGFTLGIAFMVGLYWILRRTSPTAVYGIFSKLQIASSAFMAFSHGSNDGQKFMGVFALALLLGGAATQFHVTWWIILVCGTVMALGTIIGGWRIMRTVGFKLTKLEPVNGFAAEAAGGTAITLASAFGVPLSTTHTINTAIMGVGATRRLSAVRWDVARRIVATWILTFPACFALGWILEKALGRFL
jgi:PiT family inorganic phosphate transporter